MVGSVNKVIFVGNFGVDFEVRYIQDGCFICNFCVVILEFWCDKNFGECWEKMEWYCVVIFSEGFCKIVENYLKKGFKVYFEG